MSEYVISMLESITVCLILITIFVFILLFVFGLSTINDDKRLTNIEKYISSKEKKERYFDKVVLLTNDEFKLYEKLKRKFED